MSINPRRRAEPSGCFHVVPKHERCRPPFGSCPRGITFGLRDDMGGLVAESVNKDLPLQESVCIASYVSVLGITGALG